MVNETKNKTVNQLLESFQGVNEMEQEDDIDLDIYGGNPPAENGEDVEGEEFDLDGENDETVDLDSADDTSMSDDPEAIDGIGMSDDEEILDGEDGDIEPEDMISQLKDVLAGLEAMTSDDENDLEFGDDEGDLEFEDDESEYEVEGEESDDDYEGEESDDEELEEMCDDDEYDHKEMKESRRKRLRKEESNPSKWVPGQTGNSSASSKRKQNFAEPAKTNLPPGKGAGDEGAGNSEEDIETTTNNSKGKKIAKQRGKSGAGYGAGEYRDAHTGKKSETIDIKNIKLKKEDYKVDISSEMETLLSVDSTLSEQAQLKMAKLFENAVNKKVEKIAKKLERTYNRLAQEAVSASNDALVEKVDQYLDYVVESYIEENQIAIDEGLKNRVADSFLNGMVNLFAEHYVEVPKGKENFVAKLERQLAESKSANSEMYDKAVSLRGENIKLRKQRSFNKMSEGLSEVEIGKFKTLAEDVEYKNQKQFARALGIVKSTHFNTRTKTSTKQDFTSLAEDTNKPTTSMDSYVSALSKIRK